MSTTRYHIGSTRIITWGHGLGLRIPPSLARKIGLAAGTQVEIQRQGRRIILEPKLATPTLEELLACVMPGNVPGEADWRRPADPEVKPS
jgi:antitoxin component of MazEF toxin-antitoxin module